MTMRVLQVLGRSAGGVARHVAAITAALDGDGMTVDVAGPPDLPVAMPKPVAPVVVPNGPVVGHRAAVARLRTIVDGRYDVVHAHGLRAGIDAALAARGRGVPVVVSVHNVVLADVVGRPRAALYGRAESLAVRLADRVVAASEDIARRLRARVPSAASKVEVVYLGVGDAPPATRPAGVVRAELGLGDGQRLVVTAARLEPQKALHVMLRALARLDPDVHLAILGRGPQEDELRALARRLGVAERVSWLGWRDDVADFVAAADVFCLSSVWEACALAAQEAMLLGTPVVSTDGGGMPELIDDRVGGRLVPVGDDAALASALADVLSSPDDRVRYAAAARRRLAERFSTAIMLARLREVYAGAAASR
ncbi:MAG TPA: glycosyltransferase [Actinomycetota bacterium]|nr:glycosyltransferase [Actinomycetota bacterium]